MNVEEFDFESRMSPGVRAVLNFHHPSHSYEALHDLMQAWFDYAEKNDDVSVGQCAYELICLTGPIHGAPEEPK